ncbi:MAG: serine--tRNA ligase, partial [Burkholderiales bacterium]|nr:serine--tRNA ligase [Burkholderiales bacterium]
MLDPALLRKDLDAVVRRLSSRGFAFPMDQFNGLESRRKSVQTETENLQLAESQALPAKLKALELDLADIQSQLSDMLMAIPNLPHESVPQGADSEGNIEVRRWVPQADASGDPERLPFEPRDHVTLGETIGLDFDTAAKLSGARFSFMRGPIARLHRALAQFMLDLQTGTHGYTECYTPYIVNASTLMGT